MTMVIIQQEVDVTIKAARQGWEGKRVVMVFNYHRYSKDSRFI